MGFPRREISLGVEPMESYATVRHIKVEPVPAPDRYQPGPHLSSAGQKLPVGTPIILVC